MKVFKYIYKATLCATLSAMVLTSCVNNWLDLEPSDGVEERKVSQIATTWELLLQVCMLV